MSEAFTEILSNPNTPPLTVLVVLVVFLVTAFLRFLRYAFGAIEAMVDDVKEVATRGTEVIEDNSKIQGQVLEALHRSNGHTTIDPVQHVEIGEVGKG